MEVELISISRNNSSGSLVTLNKGRKRAVTSSSFLSSVDSGEDSDDDAKSTVSHLSTTSNMSTKSNRKRKIESTYESTSGKRKQQEENTIEDEDFKEPIRKLSSQKGKVLGKIPTHTARTEAELNSMHIDELKQLTLQMLDHVELAMNSSDNLQGRIKGIMKDRICSIRDIATCFTTKAEGKGDPLFYKMQNAELRTRIKYLKKEEGKWKAERARLEEEITALNKKTEEIEIKLWEISREKYSNTTSKSVDTPTLRDESDMPKKTSMSKKTRNG